MEVGRNALAVLAWQFDAHVISVACSSARRLLPFCTLIISYNRCPNLVGRYYGKSAYPPIVEFLPLDTLSVLGMMECDMLAVIRAAVMTGLQHAPTSASSGCPAVLLPITITL